MVARSGGADRTSTKAKLANELRALGELLARVRERQQLKQSDVAQRLALPASHLSKVESGTRRLDVIEFIRLAAALDVDPGDLIREVRDAVDAVVPAG